MVPDPRLSTRERTVDAVYDALVRELVEEARQDEGVIGLLLTGSLARGDALPGTDIDLRYILTEGASRPFTSSPVDGVLVERTFLDPTSARARLQTHPMNVYAYLDGQILLDHRNVLAELRKQAEERFENYRTPDEQRAVIGFLLRCSRDKITVAADGGDWLKAAFVTATTSWQIMEGLWSVCDRPLPPSSSVRPHLHDLAEQMPDIEAKYHDLFLGDTRRRVEVALELIDWTLSRADPESVTDSVPDSDTAEAHLSRSR